MNLSSKPGLLVIAVAIQLANLQCQGLAKTCGLTNKQASSEELLAEIDRRIGETRLRINEYRKSGALTNREAYKFDKDLSQIESSEEKYKSSRFHLLAERHTWQLHRQLDHLGYKLCLQTERLDKAPAGHPAAETNTLSAYLYERLHRPAWLKRASNL